MPANREDNRRSNGRFKKGQSGNPSGRPKIDEKRQWVHDLAREHTETAILTLVEIAQNPDCSDSARVAACNAILDRGWGKPPQAIELGAAEGAGGLKVSIEWAEPEDGE